jgi:hypothetical protein
MSEGRSCVLLISLVVFFALLLLILNASLLPSLLLVFANAPFARRLTMTPSPTKIELSFSFFLLALAPFLSLRCRELTVSGSEVVVWLKGRPYYRHFRSVGRAHMGDSIVSLLHSISDSRWEKFRIDLKLFRYPHTFCHEQNELMISQYTLC